LLTLVGEIRKKENPAYWKSHIVELERHNPRATYLGFIDSSSKKYKEVLAKHAWYLFPSVEEGEPGTVLEAMTLGLVPLVTRESGIDFALDDDFGAPFEKSLAKTLTISTDQWKTLSTKAKHYTELFHSHAAWEERLVEIFRSVGAGERDLLPTASIVLTVHNKEKHVVRLLQALVTNTKSYPKWDLHIVYDGCTDASRKVAQQVLKDFPVPVYEYETPDVWEVKANNHGLKKASGKYCVILQDDNFIYETGWLENMLAWLEEHPKVAVLGGLAGVNFFRLDSDPQGENVNRSSYELHQRLDPKMDKVLSGYVFEVDAVMRGPLIMRKELLEKHGYLDETYAPLYNDDMDYCFRMRSLGYGVFCYPIDVVNENLTSAQYKNPGKETFWRTTVEKNQQLFYKRWEKDLEKNHAFQLRVPKPVWESSGRGYGLLQKARRQLHRTAALDIRKEVRARARALFVHLPGSLVRGIIAVLRKVGSRGSALADMLYVHRFEARTIPWRMANGETTLRLNYPLNASSLVCYLGTQDEPWAEAIRSRYGSSVGTIPTAQKSVSEISSSLERLARGKKCTDIDLLCLHMGGKEYEMLEHLIATGLIRKVVNLQVKFDANVPDATARMRSIQKKLRETHEITYQYEFVWENWERKER
ncbi:MAG: glycosyltransferase, partial [Patescibacteria group bacterium]|nr:glycosyltransferase [Patescibacteria group bacterium]